MIIAWAIITEAKPKEFERKTLRMTKMDFPKALKEIYYALEELHYGVFLIKSGVAGENIGSITLLRYMPKTDKDILIIIAEGTKKEINDIQSDPRISKFFR